MAQFATALWVLAFLVAIAAAIWIFIDAEARGKNGIAAALIAFVSAFYGFPLTLIVLCSWILFRPEKSLRHATSSDTDLPRELPSSIVAASTANEFLEGLGDDMKSDDSSAGDDNA